MRRPKVVVATANAAKVHEIRDILADLDVKFLELSQFPEAILPEEGDDYAVNAVAKARAAALATGCLALADDSGLEVAGLDGRPGPHSARYGGPGLDDAGRVARLLAEMADLTGEARRARFVCLAAVGVPDGRTEVTRGTCDGHILMSPRGTGGFGYDPVFESRGVGVAMAQLPDARKNEISHRARAFRELRGAVLSLLGR